MWATVLVALITGTTTAAVAIAVQLINSQNALNTKKLDILFARKADAYKIVLEKAIEFGVEPKTQEKYLALQNSVHGALIVASKEVADVLDGDPRISLHMNANRLRLADSEQEIERYRSQEWREAVERIKTAMRSDVANLVEIQPTRFRDLQRLF
jgi:hypothetical protein